MNNGIYTQHAGSMEPFWKTLVGGKLSKVSQKKTSSKKNYNRECFSMQCLVSRELLLVHVFHIVTRKDFPEIHPPMLCLCQVLLNNGLCYNVQSSFKEDTLQLSAV